MSHTKVALSHHELNISSGACLTYLGVPFHRTEKVYIAPAKLDRIEHPFDSFIFARRELRRRSSRRQETIRRTRVELGASDLALLIKVMSAVLRKNKPPSEHSDYNLKLHVGPRADVEKRWNKFRKVQQRLKVA